MKMEILLNGQPRQLDVHPMKRMLDVLREDLDLKGAKEGCGEGECGACAVLLDGELVDTCLVPAMQMAGHDVLTVEGLGSRESLDALQRCFLEEGAVHCGFCTPGMIMAACSLLARNPHPTEEETRVALAGNICRCTGYGKIVKAVAKAAAAGYGGKIAARVLCSGRDKLQMPDPVFEGDEIGRFFSPRTLRNALAALESLNAMQDAEAAGNTVIFAGGTDIGPDTKGGRISPARVLDIFSVAELKGIERVARSKDGGDYIRIGACCTNSDIMRSPIARELLPALVTASSRSGALAMQNRATIGGNIATASGAGDLPVALLALGAEAVTVGKEGERIMPLDEFIIGYRKTCLQPGELLKEVRIPIPADGSQQVFYKRGSRKALTLSRASLAMYIQVENGRIAAFRAAAGSMSPVPIRLQRLSAEMPGRELTPGLPDEAARIAYGDVNPRKTPLYRKTMIANLTHRFFSEVINGI